MRTLVSYLNANSQRLRLIAERWQASLDDRLYTGNAYELSQEMQSEFLQRRLLSRLTTPARSLLAQFLKAKDFSLNPKQLNTSEQQATLEELTACGLVFPTEKPASEGDPEAVLLKPKPRATWNEQYSNRANSNPANAAPVLVKPVLITPRELARPFRRLLQEWQAAAEPGIHTSSLPLAQLLKNAESDALEVVAERWGLLGLIGASNQPGLVQAELERALTDAVLQARRLEELPPDSQQLYQQLQATPGHGLSLEILLEDYGNLKRLGRALRPLEEALLVWEAFEETEKIFIPAEIAIPRPAQSVSALPLQTMTPPPLATLPPPYALAWDTLTLLHFIQSGQLAFTADQTFAIRDLKRLQTLSWYCQNTHTPAYQTFLLELCFNLNLYAIDKTNREALTGSGLASWLKLSLYQQAQKLAEAWLANGLLAPLSYPAYYNEKELVNTGNAAMLHWLTDCEPEQWYTLHGLLAKVQRENPYFIVPRQQLINQLGAQKFSELARRWQHQEANIIRDTFSMVLEWLGIVQIGRDEQENAIAFRLTELGSLMCQQPGAKLPQVPAAKNPISLQPNFEILLLNPQSTVIWQLARFAEQIRLDTASTYQLTQSSIIKGLESGLSLVEIKSWLEKQSGSPLPQNVQISLGEWAANFKQVRINPVTVLETNTAEVLDELLANPQYQSLFLRRLSPTCAVINLPEAKNGKPATALKELRQKIKDAGYFGAV